MKGYDIADFLFSISFYELKAFVAKLVLIYLGLPFLLVYLISFLLLRFSNAVKSPFLFNYYYSILRGILVVLLLFSVHFFWLVKTNGVTSFSWSDFSFSRNCIYLLLTPNFLGFSILVFSYIVIDNKFKKIIR